MAKIAGSRSIMMMVFTCVDQRLQEMKIFMFQYSELVRFAGYPPIPF